MRCNGNVKYRLGDSKNVVCKCVPNTTIIPVTDLPITDLPNTDLPNTDLPSTTYHPVPHSLSLIVCNKRVVLYQILAGRLLSLHIPFFDPRTGILGRHLEDEAEALDPIEF